MSKAAEVIAQSVNLAGLETLSRMTPFQKIAMLNNLAGNGPNGGWEAIEAQFKLLKDEFDELEEAIRERDINKVRAECADIEVVNLGMFHRIGADGDADLHEVVLSNLTKFDPAETDDVKQTVEKYLDINVVTSQIAAEHPLMPGQFLLVTRSAMNQTGTDQKEYRQGKWLKSHRFAKPQMPPLSEAASDALATSFMDDFDQTMTPENIAKACGRSVEEYTVIGTDLATGETTITNGASDPEIVPAE